MTSLSAFGTPVELGRGGMGVVYRATHLASGAQVALKCVREGDRSPAALGAFTRELQAIAVLDHPHVVELVAAGVAAEGDPFPAGSPWFAMALARGSLAANPPAAWSGARAVLRSVLSALAAAHAHGILHRDVAPGNVLDTAHHRTPHWRLADFGLARLGGRGRAGGTPGYRAPEQGAQEGPWTDLYGVGCLAWWLLHGAPPDAAGWGPRFATPGGLGPWLDLLLARSPTDRFQHPRAAALALAALGEPVAAAAAPAAPAPVSRSTWTEDLTDEAAAPPAAPAVLPLPADWREIAGPDGSRLLPWSTRGMVASDAGFGLLAERTPPLVGRDDAQDALWAALARVVSTGRSAVVRLVGPRGAGHTRLLEWLRRAAHASGAVAVEAPGPARLELRDRGEGGGGALPPGTLRVVVDPVPDAAPIVLPPLPVRTAGALVQLVGGRSADGVLLWVWSAGNPGSLVRWFDRVTAAGGWWEGRPRLGPARPEPPIAPADLAAARARPVSERLAALRGWPFGEFDGEGAVVELVSLPEAERLAVLRAVPDRSPEVTAVARLWAGDLGPGVDAEPTLLVQGGEVFVRDRDPHTRAWFAGADPDDPRWSASERRRLVVARITHRAGFPRDRLLAWAREVLAGEAGLAARGVAIVLLGRHGALEEALEAAERLAAEAPTDHHTDPTFAYGWCLLQARRLGEAERVLRRGTRAVHVELGELARLRGRLADAERHYLDAWRSDQGVEAGVNLALLLADRGSFAEAARLLDRVRRDPFVDAHAYARAAVRLLDARVAVAVRDPDEADRAFDEADALVRAHALADPDYRAVAARLAAELDTAGEALRAAEVRARLRAWP